MSEPQKAQRGNCTVVGAEKLPAEVGGADAICAALDRAIASKARGLQYSAEFQVPSASVLIASVTVNGRKLPQQRFGVMDRNLNQGSIERFTQSLASLVAQASEG